jgi:uncharacterized membrane protein
MMTAKTTIAIVYIATLIGILIWIGALFYAPYLKSHSSPFSGFLYAVFSPICHQIPSRCFYAFGNPVAVCARCLGIYGGFLLGTFIFPLVKGFSKPTMPKAKMLIFLSIPIIIDASGNLVGLWTSSNWVRFLTGIIWAIVLPFYFLAGLTDYFLRKKKSPNSH